MEVSQVNKKFSSIDMFDDILFLKIVQNQSSNIMKIAEINNKE